MLVSSCFAAADTLNGLTTTAGYLDWTTHTYSSDPFSAPTGGLSARTAQVGFDSSKTRSYPGEKILWGPCKSDSTALLLGSKLPLECSNVTMPMDQFNQTRSNKTFGIPVVRLRGKDGSPNVLMNFGGPGAAGVSELLESGKYFAKIMGNDFHLLAFDPRGVGTSSPEVRCTLSASTCKLGFEDMSRNIRQSSPEQYAYAKSYAEDWKMDNILDSHDAFVNTPQTAADMNSILDAVGQQNMLYWGWSYGTSLGQTYASLYPQKTHRMVIDGVMNNFDEYSNDVSNEEKTDSEKVLDGFLDECIKAGDNCALYSIADNKAQLYNQVIQFGERLKTNPLRSYDMPAGYNVLTYGVFWYRALFRTLYTPKLWFYDAQNIAAAMKGNPTPLLRTLYSQLGNHHGSHDSERYGEQSDSCSPEYDPIGLIAVNDALTGPQNWAQDRMSLLDQLTSELGQSKFWRSNSNLYYLKQQWRLPRTHNFSQSHQVRTAHPPLILSTTWDPICPMKSAKNASQIFVGSRIVEMEGYGHCADSHPSDCLTAHIRNYFRNGTLPEKDTKCTANPSFAYFPELDRDGLPINQTAFRDGEEEELHLAQVAIASKRRWTKGTSRWYL